MNLNKHYHIPPRADFLAIWWLQLKRSSFTFLRFWKLMESTFVQILCGLWGLIWSTGKRQEDLLNISFRLIHSSMKRAWRHAASGSLHLQFPAYSLYRSMLWRTSGNSNMNVGVRSDPHLCMLICMPHDVPFRKLTYLWWVVIQLHHRIWYRIMFKIVSFYLLVVRYVTLNNVIYWFWNPFLS